MKNPKKTSGVFSGKKIGNFIVDNAIIFVLMLEPIRKIVKRVEKGDET